MTQQSDGHTPTPWVAEPNAYGTWFIYRSEPTETAPTGFKYRELVCGGDGYRTLTEENADFIVEAVNNHARLTARVEELEMALERAREAIASLPPYALGEATVEHSDGGGVEYEYPLRDELLAEIDAALTPRSSVEGK